MPISIHDRSKPVIFCLLALLLSFASLVPGGPFENRDFSQLSGPVFWGFNVFLVTLGLVGFLTAYWAWKGKRPAYWLAIVVGWLYVMVIAFDLGRIFPVSPDPTSFVLGLIMICDAILALYVIFFSHKVLGHF